MANTYYITAGLSVPKDSGQSASAGVNTHFVTAGLLKVVEAAGAGVLAPQLVDGGLANRGLVDGGLVA